MQKSNREDKNEITWQIAFKNYVNDNHKDFISQNNIPISILSIGEHNKFEGPDFKNSCIKKNNSTIIGDIEFHKKTSDWTNHNHSNDTNYNNVILHIAFEEDAFFNNDFETIILNRKLLEPYQKIKEHKKKPIDDCKYLSISRLLTKTKYSYNLLKRNSIDDVFFSMLIDFLVRYSNFRTRQFNKEIDLTRIFSLLQTTYLYDCICKNKYSFDVNKLFKEFIENTNLGDISKHLKQEILTNVILPIAFCVVNSEVKTQLLLWYFSAKTRTKYGVLKYNYPDTEQKYIWQQQGMLEHYKNNYVFKFPNALNYFTASSYSNTRYLFYNTIDTDYSKPLSALQSLLFTSGTINIIDDWFPLFD